MGKRKSGFCIVFIVTFCFQMIAMPYYFSAAEPESIDTSPLSWIAPVDYLALGDSLAAGVNSDNELGKGMLISWPNPFIQSAHWSLTTKASRYLAIQQMMYSEISKMMS